MIEHVLTYFPDCVPNDKYKYCKNMLQQNNNFRNERIQ